MITYPDCQACDCGNTYIPPSTNSESSVPNSSLLSQVSNSSLYANALSSQYNANLTVTISEAMSTYGNSNFNNPKSFKCAKSSLSGFNTSIQKQTLPIGERINIFNTRNKYFEGVNKIKVTFASDNNLTYHYDNTLTVLGTSYLEAGTLLTFIDPKTSTDKNFLWSGTTGGNGGGG